MKNREEFLATLMNFLAEKYKNQLILKGGMLLRLLNSPRETQDLDYVWIRTKKRTLFAEEIKTALEKLPDIKVVDVLSNSRGIFISVMDQNSNLKAKLEISVIKALNLSPKPLTTSALSHPYALRPQVVATMDLAEALSHKIAAALERDLVRDLYDLMLMEPLTSFDEKTLRERLARLEIRRAKPRSVSPQEAARLLREKINALTEGRLRDELSALLPKEPLQGMKMVLVASVSRIIQKIEVLIKP